MKIRELLSEMPLNLNKDAPFIFNIDGTYMSNGSLSRGFSFLGEINISEISYKFWFSNNGTRALCTIVKDDSSPETKDINGDQRNLIVVDLWLKKNTVVDISDAVQVDTVSTHTDYAGIGLPSILYVVLSRYNIPVISDFSQYNGGVGLWRKLASMADARKYAVRIWDIASSDWVRDSNDVVLNYNGINLQQDEVWNSIGQTPKTLLVLSSN
jgi:hypothetical protein